VRIAGRPTIAYSSTSPVNNSGNARSGKSAQQISADNVVQREPNFVNEWKKVTRNSATADGPRDALLL